MIILWTCRNPDCERETEVEVTPIVPASTYGPPERCHPEEGGEVEPTECECGTPFDLDAIYEAAMEACWDALWDAAEARADAAMDR